VLPITQPPQPKPTIANAMAPPTAPYNAGLITSVLICMPFKIGFQSQLNNGAGSHGVSAKRISIGGSAVARLVNIDRKIEHSFASASCWQTVWHGSAGGAAGDRE